MQILPTEITPTIDVQWDFIYPSAKLYMLCYSKLKIRVLKIEYFQIFIYFLFIYIVRLSLCITRTIVSKKNGKQESNEKHKHSNKYLNSFYSVQIIIIKYFQYSCLSYRIIYVEKLPTIFSLFQHHSSTQPRSLIVDYCVILYTVFVLHTAHFILK